MLSIFHQKTLNIKLTKNTEVSQLILDISQMNPWHISIALQIFYHVKVSYFLSVKGIANENLFKLS